MAAAGSYEQFVPSAGGDEQFVPSAGSYEQFGPAAGGDEQFGPAAGGDEPSAEIDSKTMEEITVDDFITLYDSHVFTWELMKGDPDKNYFMSESLPEEIHNVIKYCQIYFEEIMDNELIYEWREVEEFPESVGTMVYSLVNLLILQNSKFIPDGLFAFISEKPERNRKQILSTIYQEVYKKIQIFNNYIKQNMKPVSSVVSRDVLNRMPPVPYESQVKPPVLYLFTGIKKVVISDSQLYDFMTSKRNHFFPLRSWTVDMRVAMQFTSEDDVNARDGTWEIPGRPGKKDERLKQLLNIKESFRLIFITAQEEILYVTPDNSWEAEVLIPSGTYYYGGAFKKRIKYYGPNSTKQEKLFLFIIINRIEYTEQRSMNLLQYKKFIDDIMSHFEGIPQVTYGLPVDDDDEDDELFNPDEGPYGKLESFKQRPYASKKYKKRKKNKSKKYKSKKIKKSKKSKKIKHYKIKNYKSKSKSKKRKRKNISPL